MTNTPDKSEMKAVERFERWLAYVKDDGDWAEEPELDEFAIILALAKSASSRPADQVSDMVERVAKAIDAEIRQQSNGDWPIRMDGDELDLVDCYLDLGRIARAAIAALQAVPASGEVGDLREALLTNVTQALWPILGGNHTDVETWDEIGKAVDSAIVAALVVAALQASGEE